MRRHDDSPVFEGRRRYAHFGRRARHFGHFGAAFPGGPGIRAAKMLAAGDLQLIILALLSEKPRHGYEIIKQVEEHSSGTYSPSPGMVYPSLTYLEEVGYADSQSVGSKKLYRITESGTTYLNQNRASVEETLDELARFGRKLAQFQKQFAEEEREQAEGFGEDAGHGIKTEWREAKREFRELRNDLKAALYEKFEAPAEERRRVFAILRRTIDEIRGNPEGTQRNSGA